MTIQGVPGVTGLLLPSLTDDGRLSTTVRPQRNTLDWPEYWSDKGDDLETNTIAAGQNMYVSGSTEGDHSILIRFNEPIQVHGGEAWLTTTFNKDDFFSVELFAGASPVDLMPSGYGNCNLVPIGGDAHLVVPSETGTHLVDLDTKIGTSSVHQVSPVPAGGTGYWNYDTDTNEITPSTPGEGDYNLFDVEIPMQKFLNHVRIREDLSQFLGADAKLVLPHWTWRVTLHHPAGTREVGCCFRLVLYREHSF